KRAAELDVFGVTAIRAFHVQVGLTDGEGFAVQLLAEEVNLGIGIDLKYATFRDGEHAARTAARVVDGAHNVIAFKRDSILRQQKVHHQANHFARRKVFTGILVQRLVNFAVHLLEDIANLEVRYLVRMAI